MKKIAIIAPCILPVPACKGGAVEELITCIINQNEISKQYAIDLYTIADCSYASKNYSCTNIIPVSLGRYTSIFDKVCDKYYRTIDISAKRLFDKAILAEFLKHLTTRVGSYYAVIVQNQMSFAVELLKATGNNRDFPVYFHMHNDVDIYRSPEYIRQLTDGGVQFIAVSNYIKSQILKYSNNAVVHVLSNGVDLDLYTEHEDRGCEDIKFLYAGRIIPEKGVKELADAFVAMANNSQFANCSLDIIGFDGLNRSYENEVKNIASKNAKIQCMNRLATEEMARRYEDYDVVVMPTKNEEPFGLVALETIAKGMPLITTNSGALPEIVGDGACVVNKDENLAYQLQLAMEKLASDSDYRIQLGKKAYNQARSNVAFSIDSYYHRLVDILDTVYSQKKVSIVVPVYNVQDQLEKCVNTLINQTYKQIEIILVDDGSTDNSGSLCDKYAEKDTRISVIHQQNMGLSGARNSGIDVATGDYIFFVDSDDYITEDAIEKLVTHMHRTNSDIVACGFAHVFDGDKPEFAFTNSDVAMWSGKQSVMQMMTTNNICSVAWNKLYKRNLWEGIRYPVGRLHEDEATTYKLLYRAGLVAFMPECLYKYYQRDNSLMNSGLARRYGDYITALQERIDYFSQYDETQLVEQSKLVLLQYLKYVYRNVDGDLKQVLKSQYNQLLGQYGIPKGISFKKKLSLFLWKFFKA